MQGFSYMSGAGPQRLRGNGYQFKTQLLRPALEIMDGFATSPDSIVILTEVDVLYPVFEHGIDDASQLVGGGGNGCGRSVAGSDTPVEGTQSALTVM
jgi:hypothetical protein